MVDPNDYFQCRYNATVETNVTNNFYHFLPRCQLCNTYLLGPIDCNQFYDECTGDGDGTESQCDQLWATDPAQVSAFPLPYSPYSDSASEPFIYTNVWGTTLVSPSLAPYERQDGTMVYWCATTV